LGVFVEFLWGTIASREELSSKWIANQPRHRLEIYERNLDWFRFWLKQEEDLDPTKAEQYLSWRRLRDGAPN
jgi:hypothetical protein